MFIVLVELLLNGSWVDITDDINTRDLVTITRGRSDWASHVQPSHCSFQVNNRDGKYSPRNPTGPYYGLLGRNTQVRVTAEENIRFVGEVSEWPMRTDDTGTDLYVTVEAYGVLRRLNRGATPLRSVAYRTLLQRGVLPVPVAYWPCEDGSDSTALWSALAGRRPMTISPDLQLASFSGFACSESIPVSNDTQFFGNIRAYDPSGDTVTALCLVHLPDDGLVADGSSVMVCNGTGTGSYWRVQANIDRTVRLQLADDDGAVISTSGNSSFTIGTSGALLGLRLTQSGANVSYAIRVYNVGATAVQLHTGTILNRTYGRITRITIGSTRNLGQTAVGHVALFQGFPDDDALQGAVNAYVGEPAGRRIERLCLEEQVPLATVGYLDDTQPVGPQRARKLTELLEEAADVDGGILYEPTHVRTVLGDFEDGTTQGWVGGGTDPPTVAFSSVRWHSGGGSLLATWVGGSTDQIVHVAQPGRYVVGTTYTASGWLWVPAGSTPVSIAVGGVGFGPATSVTDAWQELTFTWTCTSTDNEVQFWATTPAGVGAQVWIDDVIVSTDRPGLAYRSRKSLYNTDATLALDFAAGHLAPPLEPTDDDQLLLNDVTVAREGGSSARHEVTTGPLSVNEPPDGVGRYNGGGTYNVETDDDAGHLAAWLAHLGTWDEQRYPRLSVNLAKNPDLVADAALVDMGDRITVANTPSWLPPEDIDQMAQGYTETVDLIEWKIEFNCTPWRPFQVATVGNARLDSLHSTLNVGIDSNVTSMDVVVETGRAEWIKSAEKPALFPFLILVGGEEMSVSAITAPAAGVQTFTVARSVNGVVKAHDAGTSVRVKTKAYVPR